MPGVHRVIEIRKWPEGRGAKLGVTNLDRLIPFGVAIEKDPGLRTQGNIEGLCIASSNAKKGQYPVVRL